MKVIATPSSTPRMVISAWLVLIPPLSSPGRRVEGGEATREIGDEIGRILQADVQPHHRAFRLPCRRTAQPLRIDRQGEAFEAAPGEADAETLQRIDQRDPRGIVAAGKDEGEETRRPLEVALPDIMAGTAGQRRMQHARDLRLPGEPARDRETVLAMRFQPHRERAQTAA